MSFLNLRKEAHIHKMINTVSAIKSVENLTRILSWLVPRLRCNTRLTAPDRDNLLTDQAETRTGYTHKCLSIHF